jgi:hypothetical protein
MRHAINKVIGVCEFAMLKPPKEIIEKPKNAMCCIHQI